MVNYIFLQLHIFSSNFILIALNRGAFINRQSLKRMSNISGLEIPLYDRVLIRKKSGKKMEGKRRENTGRAGLLSCVLA